MTVLKCKMCGGDLQVQEGMSTCKCEYCGSVQTIPTLDDEKIAYMYNRANFFRLKNEFDKASLVYENIIADRMYDAEAYWGLVLCEYGITYVDDPVECRRVPTINKTQTTSIYNDINFKSAIENADPSQKEIYEQEAAYIDKIQKEYNEILHTSDPYDVFICYKETDEYGKRTQDSIKAQEVYDTLTASGYRVFYSRITLKSKAGSQFEPYIYSALSTAKIMIVIGTEKDRFESVWVKNEWSRFLSMKEQDKSKSIIVLYEDEVVNDMPDEFYSLMTQSMDENGYLQELLRGIKDMMAQSSANLQNTLNNVSDDYKDKLNIIEMYIKEKDFERANIRCERLLDEDIKNPDAYFYKTLIAIKEKDNEGLSENSAKFLELSPEINLAETMYIESKGLISTLIYYIKIGAIERIKDVFNGNSLFGKINASLVFEEAQAKRGSLLNFAVRFCDDISILEYLIEKGADVNESYRRIKSDVGLTKHYVLSEAVWNKKSPEKVEVLLRHGANPNLISTGYYSNDKPKEESVLSEAVRIAKSPEIVRLLIKYGADPKAAYRIKTTDYGKIKIGLLEDAVATAKNNEIVEILLDCGLDPNELLTGIYINGQKKKESILNNAVRLSESVQIVEALLKHGAQPNESYRTLFDEEYVTEYSVLSDATWNVKSPEMVETLLKYGADPNMIQDGYYTDRGIRKESVLNEAIRLSNSPEIVELLLKYGADPNKSYREYINTYGNKTKFSPLTDAITKAKDTKMVNILLDNGADPNSMGHGFYDEGTVREESALNEAIRYLPDPEVVESFLNHGADPNKLYRLYTGKFGNIKYSPLADSIVIMENLELSKIILEHGADPNEVIEGCFDDGKGKASSLPLLHFMVLKNSEQLIELLLSHGANWNSTMRLHGGMKHKQKHFPYDKKFKFSKTYVEWLKKHGWRG